MQNEPRFGDCLQYIGLKQEMIKFRKLTLLLLAVVVLSIQSLQSNSKVTTNDCTGEADWSGKPVL